MTIAERIQLHKLGYTKEEIKELINAEYDPKALEEDPKPAPEAVQPGEKQVTPEMTVTDGQPKPTPDPQAEILKAIQGLTATIQQSNIISSRQPEAQKDTAEDVLYNMM